MISCSCGEISGFDFARRDGIVQQPVIHDREGIRAAKRHLPGQHFVEHHAQRVKIAARIAAFGLDLLGRNIVGGPHGLRNLARTSAAAPLGAGDAEIDQLDVVFGVHHDVFRLQIAVHDAMSVDVIECIAEYPA